MSVRKNAPSPLRLTLPAAAIRRLREAGIYCTPEISLEFQRTSKRYVLRGRESGGATKQIGRYVTFCGEQGQRLPWFLRPDSVTPNAEHAIVIAPALVSVEMFRIEHTYELLIAQHQVHTVKEGSRPTISTRVVFRGWQGQLPVDLVEKDRGLPGESRPSSSVERGAQAVAGCFCGRGSGRNPWVKLWAVRTFALLNCAKKWRRYRYCSGRRLCRGQGISHCAVQSEKIAENGG